MRLLGDPALVEAQVVIYHVEHERAKSVRRRRSDLDALCQISFWSSTIHQRSAIPSPSERSLSPSQRLRRTPHSRIALIGLFDIDRKVSSIRIATFRPWNSRLCARLAGKGVTQSRNHLDPRSNPSRQACEPAKSSVAWPRPSPRARNRCSWWLAKLSGTLNRRS